MRIPNTATYFFDSRIIRSCNKINYPIIGGQTFLSGCKRQAGMPVLLRQAGMPVLLRQAGMPVLLRQAGMPVLLIAIGQIILLQCLKVALQYGAGQFTAQSIM
jgi:hypothetical protein